jgi:hypothetical protein
VDNECDYGDNQQQVKHAAGDVKGDAEDHPREKKDEGKYEKNETAHEASIASRAVRTGITQLLQSKRRIPVRVEL